MNHHRGGFNKVQATGFRPWHSAAEAARLNYGSPVAGHGSAPIPQSGTGQSRGSLENAWIEIFRVGDYGDRGRWTERDLDQLAASYNPRLQAAPVVLGHPTQDAPAFAWVKALRRAGGSLWAQLQQVDPAFEQLLRAGRFRSRSVALYTHFLPTGGPYLRHLGFLGAQAPEVKALAPVRFLESNTVSIEFHGDPCPATRSAVRLPLTVPSESRGTSSGSPRACRGATSDQSDLSNPVAPLSRAKSRDATGSPEEHMPEPKSKLENFLDHLRAFFAEPAAAPGSGDESTKDSSSAFAERIAQLEQRLDQLAEEKHTAEQRLAERDTVQRSHEIETFIETLRGRGKFPPVFERLGVRAFLEALAEADATRAATAPAELEQPMPEARSTKHEGSLVAWFQEFLTRLPAVIDFRELASDTSQGSRVTSHEKLVRFTEPHRGVAIDPESVELAERAQTLAAELGISYADALTRIREESRARGSAY